MSQVCPPGQAFLLKKWIARVFGHGFIPRLTARNRSGVMRALAPADLTGGEPINMPWAVVDAATAIADPALMTILREAGTNRLVDTEAWRYSDARTWQVDRWATLPHTPAAPYDGSERWIQDYVRRDLQLQASLDASMYLLPTWFDNDPLTMTRRVFDAAVNALEHVPARPFVANVAVRSGQLRAEVDRLPAGLPSGLSGVRLYVTPLRPLNDPVHKLELVSRILVGVGQHGLSAIAAAGGAAGVALRGLGIAAAECGLGEAEQFDAARVLYSSSRPSEKGKGNRRPGPPIYVPEVNRSVSGTPWKAIAAVPSAFAAVRCRRRCHKWTMGGAHAQDMAVEHSLICRVEEAEAIARMPRTMRIDAAYRLLRDRQATIRQVNGALKAADLKPIPHQGTDNHIALLTKLHGRFEAA
jgi:hypothetical protein